MRERITLVRAAHPEDRIPRGDALEFRHRGLGIHRHVRAGAGREPQITLQNRRAGGDINLLETDGLAAPMARAASPPAARTLATELTRSPSIATR